MVTNEKVTNWYKTLILAKNLYYTAQGFATVPDLKQEAEARTETLFKAYTLNAVATLCLCTCFSSALRYSHCLQPHVFTFFSSQIPPNLPAGLLCFSIAAKMSYQNLIFFFSRRILHYYLQYSSPFGKKQRFSFFQIDTYSGFVALFLWTHWSSIQRIFKLSCKGKPTNTCRHFSSECDWSYCATTHLRLKAYSYIYYQSYTTDTSGYSCEEMMYLSSLWCFNFNSDWCLVNCGINM